MERNKPAAEIQAPVSAPSESVVEDTSQLPEREMVWALESPIPGMLCVLNIHVTERSYIHVFASEDAALSHLVRGAWAVPVEGIKPIQISMESIKQQAIEQRPSRFYGYPCAGYVWLPSETYVEVVG